MVRKKRIVLICFLVLLLLLATPGAAAQDDEGDGGEEDTTGVTCIFCSIILIILFIVYIAYEGSKRRRQERGGYDPSAYGPYSPTHGERQPQYRAPPPQAQVQRGEVKCDLCASKNLRFFEEGYVKCNDCRHVFHVSEGYSRRRGR